MGGRRAFDRRRSRTDLKVKAKASATHGPYQAMRVSRFRHLCVITSTRAMERIQMRGTISLIGLGLVLFGTAAAAQPAPPPDPGRDIYCRQSAAASTGYVTPRQAAENAQATGTIGGLLGGAALGAIIGGRRNAGAGAAIGAVGGAIAGSAVGANNANAAANEVRARYSQTYYACMYGGYGPPPAGYYAPEPPPPPPEGYPPPPPGAAYPPPPESYPPPPPGAYPPPPPGGYPPPPGAYPPPYPQ